jgi:hypothetical protein
MKQLRSNIYEQGKVTKPICEFDKAQKYLREVASMKIRSRAHERKEAK